MLRTVRVSPRWPAEGERFTDGWEWQALTVVAPLLELLADGATGDAERIESALSRTLSTICEATGFVHAQGRTTLALLVLDDAANLARDHRARLVLRHVQRSGDSGPSAPPVLEVPADEPVTPPVAEALRHLGIAAAALEVPLEAGRGGRLIGWLLVLHPLHPDASPSNLDWWMKRHRRWIKRVAWVLALSLRPGWQAWRSRPDWPALDAAELALCRAAWAAVQDMQRPDRPRFSGVRSGVEDEGDDEDSDDEATVVLAPPEEPAPPRPVDENVQFTVYRPRRIPPAVWCPVLAFAHLAERRADAPDGAVDPVEEVRRQARQVLGDAVASYADTTQDSRQGIPREGEITFVLDLPSLEVNPPQRSFRWCEDVQREEFRVRAPAHLDGSTQRGELHVYLGALRIADVALAMQVDAAATGASASESEASHARPYRRIFPSYAHRDEAIVRQVESYARTMGDEYLRDVTHLRSGEVWNDRLMAFIRAADVFQLFWSRNSMTSPWVRQEWEYALSLGRPHFVRPTYWESPMPAAPERDLPPAALRALHFQRLPIAAAPDEDTAGGARTVGVPAPAPPASEPARARPPASAGPSPPPPRRGLRGLPTALAALLLVGLIGGSLVFRQVGMSPPPPGTVATGPLETVSPDGTMLASMDAEGRIRIAAHGGGEPLVIATKFRTSDVAALRFSADGSRIVCELRDGGTVEWDARTGSRIARTATPLTTAA